MTVLQCNERIREYWNSRAQERKLSNTATTDDVYLRELEIETFASAIAALSLPATAQIADIGCGDGYSTSSLARRLPQYQFAGLDYSEQMIQLATARLSEQELANIHFRTGDVLKLDAYLAPQSLDVALTDRCLINLDSYESQAEAIRQIAVSLRPGGYLVAIENFIEGQTELTAARQRLDLAEIPIRWHNRFLTEPEFVAATRAYFDVPEYRNFSSTYYLATRVIYSALCKEEGAEPNYRHPIHRLATQLPWSGNFSPIRMAIVRRKVTEGGR